MQHAVLHSTVMDRLSGSIFVSMLRAGAEKIEASKSELTELDCLIGDGDHGTTMAMVMDTAASAAEKYKGNDFKGILSAVSTAILSVGGGATVPLLGSLFGGMSSSVPEEISEVSVRELAAAFNKGAERLLKLSKAAEGDKTLIDALIPAIGAMKAESESGSDMVRMLEAAASAAADGAERTKGYAARHGRAKNLGERTIGVSDPGAVSISLILRAFADRAKGVCDGR